MTNNQRQREQSDLLDTALSLTMLGAIIVAMGIGVLLQAGIQLAVWLWWKGVQGWRFVAGLCR